MTIYLFPRTIDRIYHGCVYANVDGTNKLIAEGDACLIPTNTCFWKDASDVATHVKTRSMTKKERSVSLKGFNKYFKDKKKEHDRWNLSL